MVQTKKAAHKELLIAYCLLLIAHLQVQAIPYTEGFQQPDDNGNDDDHVDNLLDFIIHGNKAVNQPEDDTDYNQDNDDVNKCRHNNGLWLVMQYTSKERALL